MLVSMVNPSRFLAQQERQNIVVYHVFVRETCLVNLVNNFTVQRHTLLDEKLYQVRVLRNTSNEQNAMFLREICRPCAARLNNCACTQQATALSPINRTGGT